MHGVNILVCGLYFSGSGAVKDLLKEYRSTNIIPGEFDDFRRVGLVGDNLCGLISDDNPSRVKALTRNFMESSSLYSQVGMLKAIKNRLKYNYFKLLFNIAVKPSNIVQKRMLLLEELETDLLKSKNKDSLSRVVRWLEQLKRIYSKNSQFYVFDQPIFLGQHFEVWPKIFSPFKLIIVFRDPRDQVSEIIRNKNLYKDMLTPTQGLFEKYGSGKNAAISYHIDLIKHRAKNALKLREKLGDDQVLFLRFEDLIENYEKSKEHIQKFIGLKAQDHQNQGFFLEPERSAKNIGIYKEILNQESILLFEDCLKYFNSQLGLEGQYD